MSLRTPSGLSRSRLSRSRLSRLARLVVAAAVVVGGAALGAGAAAPAMAAPFSFQLSGGQPDFGFVKAGSPVTRTFTLLNDGDNAIAIDPAPLFTLNAPFTAGAVSFTTTTVIPKNGRVTFDVTYSEPVPGLVGNQTVTLVATDQLDLEKKSLAINFKAVSTATDPAHFTATTDSGATADFGSVTAGQTAKRVVTLTVDGVVPVRFSNGTIALVDGANQPLAGVSLTSSSFGDAGALTNPGSTATFELTYAPTAAGSLVGRAVVSGLPVTGGAEASSVVVAVPLVGAAVAVGPTTPPATTAPPTTPPGTGTPAPTTLGTTSTPGATQTAGQPGGGRGGSGSGGSGSGSGSGGSLAETGLPAAALVGFAGMLAVGGAAAAFTARRRSAQLGRSGK